MTLFRRSLLSVLVAFISAIGIALVYSSNRHNRDKPYPSSKITEPSVVEYGTLSSSDNENSRQTTVDAPTSSDTVELDWLSEAQRHMTQFEFDHLLFDPVWQQTHGGNVSIDTYYGLYDEETLRSMALSGDHIAQFTLGIMLTVSGDPEAAIEFHKEAAVGGVSASLAHISKIHLKSAIDSDQQELMTDAYAWSLVAEIRGDPGGLDVRGSVERKAKEVFDGFEIDTELACEMAIDIYNDLSDERTRRRMEPFENPPPTKSVTDLSRFGNVCSKWPVSRTECSAEPLSDEYRYPIYHCGVR